MDSKDRVEMLKADASYWWANSVVLKIFAAALLIYLLMAAVFSVFMVW